MVLVSYRLPQQRLLDAGLRVWSSLLDYTTTTCLVYETSQVVVVIGQTTRDLYKDFSNDYEIIHVDASEIVRDTDFVVETLNELIDARRN